MKNCIKCKTLKPNLDFGKRKNSKDGLDCYCKLCRQEYYKSKNYNRKLYQSSYKRIITPSRKQYLKEYNIKNQHKYYTIKPKIERTTNNTKEIKSINNLVWRTLNYKNESKLKLSKDYLGWTKSCFVIKFGNIPENYHIDHKVPVSWFIKETPVYLINSLSNLQLLPASENVKKRNKFSHPICVEYYNSIQKFIKKAYIEKIQII